MDVNTLSAEIENAIKEVLEKAPERGFTESVELAINLKNIDMNKPQNRLKEELVLPSGLGRTAKTAVFARGEVAMQAEKAGADLVIPPEEISELGKDKKRARALAKEYDFFVAEASMMPNIGKNLGPILAPRGKMPTPLPPEANVAQLLDRLKKTVKLTSKDKITFHLMIGRADMSVDELTKNLDAVIKRLKSKVDMNNNVKSIYVKTTMGPPVRVI